MLVTISICNMLIPQIYYLNGLILINKKQLCNLNVKILKNTKLFTNIIMTFKKILRYKMLSNIIMDNLQQW